MNSSQFDKFLANDGPVAITLTEELEPALGAHATLFPPTFAPPENSDEKANYVLDDNGTCLVDSVGSQANRLEPIFKQPPFRQLVPEFKLKIGNREADILDLGHRAADAALRYSDKAQDLQDAFLAYRDNADATRLAKLAPTSLVFGAWDSRDTNTKVPRLLESSIRAEGATRLSRAAQFTPAIRKQEAEDLGLSDLGKTLGELGLSDSPSGITPGGIIARGGVKREAILNLIPLRALGAPTDEETRKLQRYILGLALIALTAPTQLYLRQGCVLVAKTDSAAQMKLAWRDGRREPKGISADDALTFATSAAAEFRIGKPIRATFDPKLVKADAAKKKSKKEKGVTA